MDAHLETCIWLAGDNPEIHENGGREWICDPACMVGMMPLMKTVKRGETELIGPDAIPMDMLRPHEKRAKSTHGQTLDRLKERGGLGPIEALAIIEDYNPYGKRIKPAQRQQALSRLYLLMEEHESTSPGV